MYCHKSRWWNGLHKALKMPRDYIPCGFESRSGHKKGIPMKSWGLYASFLLNFVLLYWVTFNNSLKIMALESHTDIEIGGIDAHIDVLRARVLRNYSMCLKCSGQ